MVSINNAQKTPLARSLNRFATQKALDAISLLGKSLPATVTAVQGTIVTVAFDIQSNSITLPNVTCPATFGQWIRAPIQIGDQGIVVPSDVSLGGISGLGTGTASLGLVANLSALVWLPVANVAWSMDDPNAALINGPNGAIVRTQDKTCAVTVSRTGVTITVPASKTLTIAALPASAAGLPSGGLWRNGTQVMVVP